MSTVLDFDTPTAAAVGRAVDASRDGASRCSPARVCRPTPASRLPRQGRAHAHPDDGAAVPLQRGGTPTVLGRQSPGMAGFRGIPPQRRARSARGLESAGVARGHHAERRRPARARRQPPCRRAARHDAPRALHALRAGVRSPRPGGARRADNPWITVPDAVELGPDGDVLPPRATASCAVCSVCDGMLKPDVVFFGEYIPAPSSPRPSNSSRRARLSSSPVPRWS
jgi:hypothetical protein